MRYHKLSLLLLLAPLYAGLPAGAASAGAPATPLLRVKATQDFEITGDGTSALWNNASWTPLNRRPNGGHDYDARVKMLYSAKGIYVLMDGTDKFLTATMTEDFDDLWTEDVFEVFLWTDERYPIYFEYEISPLGRELPILVPNFEGHFLGWRPWHYTGERRIKKKVAISGGPQQSGAAIAGWRAEIFFPYEVLKPLQNVPPSSGTRWRANFYRVDHDENKKTAWDWSRVGPSFHEFRKYGTLVFE